MSNAKPTTHAPRAVGDTDFDATVLAAKVPVLVDFHADWCAPCRALAPVLDELAADHGDGALLVKVDTDANPELVERFRISSIPTLVLIRDGEEVERVVGATGKDELAARLAALSVST